MLGSKLALLMVLMAVGIVNAQTSNRKPKSWKIDFVDAQGTITSESGYGERECTTVTSGEFLKEWTKYNGPAPGNVKNTCCIQQYTDVGCTAQINNICKLQKNLKKTSLYYRIVNC
ncbi:hypothetical protein INT44_003703 [Umbelopsis vinacea]|uniref:Uncharacterized protein n=1 Tax=Umbelopsis vinacea TaxID=44442 RepID=A0A8H7UCL8_9FUNG|nr:hypothetical protein INT44_003703 [Umbelopsis vinacea]